LNATSASINNIVPFSKEKVNTTNNFMQNKQNNAQIQNKSFEDIAMDAMDSVEIETAKSPLQDRNINTIGKQTNVNA
jgi:hypothetical protein